MMQVVVEGEPSVLTQRHATERSTPLQLFLRYRNMLGIEQDTAHTPSLYDLLENGLKMENRQFSLSWTPTIYEGDMKYRFVAVHVDY